MESAERKRFFSVNVRGYARDRGFCVYRPASLDNPADNSVMMITSGYMGRAAVLEGVSECLIFFPKEFEPSPSVCARNAVVVCDDPHNAFCRFFRDNKIDNLPKSCGGVMKGGAFICDGALIGDGTKVFPFAYIGGGVSIGKRCFIGAGVKIVGDVRIGDDVVIRENAIIGADGLKTVRDEDGRAITMPQFGGVVIENGVQVGAGTVIARGAIDDTVIGEYSKIDNSCFISHNVRMGADTFVVGESILFGSVRTGKRVMISGNATVRNGVAIGNGATVGMGAVVTKNVEEGAVVLGNPAKAR